MIEVIRAAWRRYSTALTEFDRNDSREARRNRMGIVLPMFMMILGGIIFGEGVAKDDDQEKLLGGSQIVVMTILSALGIRRAIRFYVEKKPR